jgi:hypothetical protein
MGLGQPARWRPVRFDAELRRSAQNVKFALKRAVSVHFVDMAWSPCAEADGSGIPVPAIFGVSLLMECRHLHKWTGVACDPDTNH